MASPFNNSTQHLSHLENEDYNKIINKPVANCSSLLGHDASENLKTFELLTNNSHESFGKQLKRDSTFVNNVPVEHLNKISKIREYTVFRGI
jgi:hypothetical protein